MIEEILIEYKGTFIAVLVAFIGILGAFSVQRYVAFRNASKAFRDAFAATLTALRHSRVNTFDILEPAFPTHEAAVFEFSRFLGFKSKSFMTEWQQYCRHESQAEGRFLEQYSSVGCGISEGQRRRKLAVDRIEHLLTYAKEA